MSTTVLISISGGSSSGKKTVQSGLCAALKAASNGALRIEMVHMRDFLRATDGGNSEALEAFDLDLMADSLTARLSEGTVDVVIAEGAYLLAHKRLIDLATVKIFVDCDADVRLARRVTHTQSPSTAATPLTTILDHYVRYSKPAYEQTILPTKTISDIILPAGAEGPGIELIAHGVMDDLKTRSKARRRSLGAVGSGAVKGSGAGGGGNFMLSEVDLTTGGTAYYQAV